MTFKHVIPLVEARLYSWSLRKLEYPDPPISRVYDPESLTPPKKAQKGISQPEAWVLRHQYELWEASVIERVLKGLSHELQQLVELRYIQRWTWQKIAEALNVHERTVFRLRDQVLVILAYEFGLLQKDENDEAVSPG